ncbi:MAG: MFS transporter [Gammaproteobacteria bacterium]
MLAALVVGGTTLLATKGWLLIIVALIAVVAFIVNERKAMRPIFDLRLFMTNRVFGLSCLSAFLMYTATYANVVLVGLYLQYLQGLAPAKAGLVMMTQPLTMALFAPVSGRLSDRVEPRILASAGMVFTVVGLVVLSMLGKQSAMTHVYAALITTGMGFGLFSAPNTNAILSSVERKLYNMANSQVATMRMLGQMCSMGIIAVVFALVLGPVKITPEVYEGLRTALRLSYLTAAAFCVPAIFFSLARGSVHAADRATS